MSNKSHVGLGHKVCPVCHVKHDEVVLLDMRLRESLPPDNFMGFELCPEHAAMSDEYLAVVEAEKKDGGIALNGESMHVKWEAAERMFGHKGKTHPFVWAEVGFVEKVRSLYEARGEQE